MINDYRRLRPAIDVAAAIGVTFAAAAISLVLTTACVANAVRTILNTRDSLREPPSNIVFDPRMTTVVLMGLVLAWWRPFPSAGVAVAAILVASLMWASLVHGLREGGVGHSGGLSSQLQASLDALVVAVTLAALILSAASWPSSTGTFDGRAEGIASVAALALALFAGLRRPPLGNMRGWPVIAAFTVGVALIGWTEFQRHPELALSGMGIAGSVLAGSFRSNRQALLPSAGRPSAEASMIRSIIEASAMALLVFIGLSLDWGLRAPR